MKTLEALAAMHASAETMSRAFRQLVHCMRVLGMPDAQSVQLETVASMYEEFTSKIDAAVRVAISESAAKGK